MSASRRLSAAGVGARPQQHESQQCHRPERHGKDRHDPLAPRIDDARAITDAASAQRFPQRSCGKISTQTPPFALTVTRRSSESGSFCKEPLKNARKQDSADAGMQVELQFPGFGSYFQRIAGDLIWFERKRAVFPLLKLST